ncbi:hypothetical protein [Thomasclavelia spiroformis]|uniref:hypothetical protein n=1 Tax=Thomasclavelia spiroformis TaxID=29348 RepID=UPI0026DC6C78|nr:hypothetical protein [Thomasclavelia spiroformis]
MKISIKNIQLILSIFIILWLNAGIFSYVQNYIPNVFKLLIVIVWFILAFIDKRFLKIYLRIVFGIIIFILAMLISKLFGNDAYYNYNFQSYIYILIIIAVAIYYIYDNQIKRKKIILYAILIDYCYIGINTFFQLQLNPSISRILATSSEHASSIIGDISIKGVGSYGYFYGLVILGILLAYQFLWSKRKVSLFLLLLGIFILLLNAQFTMALIFFILFIFIVFIFENKSFNGKFIFKMIMIFLFIILLLNISTILNTLSNYVGEDLGQRLRELNDFLIGNKRTDGDIATRVDIYLMSIEIFKNNIFFGSFGKKTFGGHSSILDMFASYGLIGVLVIYTFFKMYKLIVRNVNINQKNIVKIVFFYYIILSFLNPSHISTIVISLFITLPLFLSSYHQKFKNKNQLRFND